jgi:ABC-type branched-subunit amino acid transport system substrate-binding protein
MTVVPSFAADTRIGALFPMSGPGAVYGQVFSSGANLALEHVNADHLLSGTLSIAYEDSQGAPMQGVIGMNKLVNVEHVPYVRSAFTSIAKAIAPISSRSRTVAANGAGVGPDLAELGPYFWNIIPLANAEIRAMVPYLVQQRHLKRFVLVYVDDPLGQAIKNELEVTLPSLGAKLVEALAVPVSSQQFGSVAARIRAASPDLVFIASYGAQQLQLVKQLRDNGVSQQLASYSAFSVPDIASLPEARGALFTAPQIDWEAKDSVTQRFVRDYKQEYGKMPTLYAANYYNAVRLFARLAVALEKQHKPITGENLLMERSALGTIDLVGGTVSFPANGTVNAPIQINEIDGQSGKVVQAGIVPSAR